MERVGEFGRQKWSAIAWLNNNNASAQRLASPAGNDGRIGESPRIREKTLEFFDNLFIPPWIFNKLISGFLRGHFHLFCPVVGVDVANFVVNQAMEGTLTLGRSGEGLSITGLLQFLAQVPKE